MSLKIKQVIAANDALALLVHNDRENKFVFPSAVRIKFALNLRKVKDVVEVFYKEHNALIKSLGEQQVDPANPSAEPVFKVTDPEKIKELNLLRNDMLEQVTDVTLSPVDLQQLGDNQLPIDLIVVLLDTGLAKE